MSSGTVLDERPRAALLIAKYLLPGERLVRVQRRHWVSLSKPLAVAGGGLLLALVLDVALPRSATLPRQIVWTLVLAGFGYLGFQGVRWWADRFVVTDKRVLLVHGLLVREVDMIPLTKVTDMRYERTIPGRLLGYGVFVMDSAGKGGALSRVDHIREPDWLYREICTLLFTPDQSPRGPIPAPARAAAGTGWPGFGPSDPDPEGRRD
jgi:hypothetical protein